MFRLFAVLALLSVWLAWPASAKADLTQQTNEQHVSVPQVVGGLSTMAAAESLDRHRKLLTGCRRGPGRVRAFLGRVAHHVPRPLERLRGHNVRARRGWESGQAAAPPVIALPKRGVMPAK